MPDEGEGSSTEVEDPSQPEDPAGQPRDVTTTTTPGRRGRPSMVQDRDITGYFRGESLFREFKGVWLSIRVTGKP